MKGTMFLGQAIQYNCGCEKTVCLARFSKTSTILCGNDCHKCSDFKGKNFKRDACSVHETRSPYNGERKVISNLKYR